MRISLFVLWSTLAIGAGSSFAAEFNVDQKGNTFTPTALKIKVGDSVNFRNLDNHYHNVFSLTDGQSFDLGSYGQGQSRKQTFTKPGKVDVECAIHPAMKLTIEVSQ